MLIWIILFGFVTETIALKYGIPHLFFDPEYMGEVSFVSFYILGFAFGGFFITWNITSYILNAYRFPFLATLSRPFVKYSLNNFIIPLTFFVAYIIYLYRFQVTAELISKTEVITRVIGLIAGFFSITSLSFAYFFTTNANLAKILGLGENLDSDLDYKKVDTDNAMSLKKAMLLERGWRVDTYLSHFHKARPVRSTEHYDSKLLKRVFFQNHANALIVEMVTFVFLVSLGYLTDLQLFRIPAAASALLFFSILIMFVGAMGFWLRGWRTFSFIALMIGGNYFLMSETFDFKHQAFGLDYDLEPAAYNYDELTKMSSKVNVFKDKQRTMEILENWKAKFPKDEKPKMIFINASGGGLRSAVWTMNVLQKLNESTHGDLMKQSILITGASGGMVGASYFRELYLKKIKEEISNPSDEQYLNNMSRDMLNALTLSIATNDLFNPFQKIKMGDNTYSKDRGYAFEQQLHENTLGALDKCLIDYREDEYKSKIPMMFLTPVIMKDGRSMVISAQDISYICRPAQKETAQIEAEIEGVEFRKLFKYNDGDSLRFSTALRLNATFPYITPNVSLPTSPVIEITDAGMRDNYGTTYATKFLYNFKDWIAENTSGIVFLQIRDTHKRFMDDQENKPSPIGRVFYPIGNFFTNWQKFQDYQSDNLIGSAFNWFEGNIDLVSFQYSPDANQKRASLSWHLTKLEQNMIKESLDAEVNQNSFRNLMKLMDKNYLELD